jgi:hypothetical protein
MVSKSMSQYNSTAQVPKGYARSLIILSNTPISRHTCHAYWRITNIDLGKLWYTVMHGAFLTHAQIANHRVVHWLRNTVDHLFFAPSRRSLITPHHQIPSTERSKRRRMQAIDVRISRRKKEYLEYNPVMYKI